MSDINEDYEDDIDISPPTPGPWMVVTSWYDHMVEGLNGEEIIWQDGPYNTPTIKLANARLMAAAPEMYELIEQVADLHNPRFDGAAYIELVTEMDRLADLAQELLAKIEENNNAE